MLVFMILMNLSTVIIFNQIFYSLPILIILKETRSIMHRMRLLLCHLVYTTIEKEYSIKCISFIPNSVKFHDSQSE